MEYNSTLNVCRVCLRLIKPEESVLSIHQISELLMSFTNLSILQDDGLPSKICTNCNKQANEAYKFKLLCEQSDLKLRNAHNATPCQNDNSKVELKTEDGCKSACDAQSIPKGNVGKILEEDKIRLQLKCRYCNLVFVQQTNLARHEIKHENGISCNRCGKSFVSFKQLRSHINIHNRKGAHLCQTCGKQFTLPENLVRHQRIHMGIRPHKCKICSKSFIQSNELKSHMITHSLEKTHLCNVCGNKYARHMSLQIHMRRLHSDSSVTRPHQCNICSRKFKDKRDLSQHSSIHNGERKHICKDCNKAFNRRSNLKVHERIHSGDRPFVCHICQRTFIQKHVLNNHLRTHPSV